MPLAVAASINEADNLIAKKKKEWKREYDEDTTILRRSIWLLVLFLLVTLVVVVYSKDAAVLATSPTTPTFPHETEQETNKNNNEENDEDVIPTSTLNSEECNVVTSPYEQANCGSNYELKPYNERMHIVVVNHHDGAKESSGCPIRVGKGGACPLAPKCRFTPHNSLLPIEKKTTYDAVLIMPKQAEYVNQISPRKLHKTDVSKKEWEVEGKRNPYRILFWPHPDLEKTTSKSLQTGEFDFVMGVHFALANVINPQYALSPHTLFRNLEKSHIAAVTTSGEKEHDNDIIKKKKFAIAILTHCGSQSRRNTYLESLYKYLGVNRLHVYGTSDCGDAKLRVLSWPLNERGEKMSAEQLISEYRFYFTFEGAIQNGYVTSKLFNALMFDSVPVYVGSPLPFPITTSKSYVDVNSNNFRSPRALTEYLLSLENNPKEYEEYFQWKRLAWVNRSDSSMFTEAYLSYVAATVPGPRELQIHGNNLQLALCCRLCNLDNLKKATSEHYAKQTYIAPKYTDEQVLHTFFQNV